MVEVSKETFDVLSNLQTLAKQIFNKKQISFDKLIFWLLNTKIDWVDLVASKEIVSDEKPLETLSRLEHRPSSFRANKQTNKQKHR